MNLAKRFSWLIMLLIALASTGWFFAGGKPVIRLDDKALATMPDAIADQLVVRQYNEQGQLINLLEAPRLKHRQKDDAHWLEQPRIVVSETDQPQWEIQAQLAHAIHGGEKIILSKEVVVHQQAGLKTPASTFKTDKIIYFPKTKKAMTDLPVVFEQPGTVVHSTGMVADLAEKRVKLLHKARGSYVPNQG